HAAGGRRGLRTRTDRHPAPPPAPQLPAGRLHPPALHGAGFRRPLGCVRTGAGGHLRAARPLAGGGFMTALLAAALLSAPLSGAGWNLRDHIPLSEVVVQSHRGAGVLSPENSIEAFEIAWRLGTIPEADLRTTRDGVIVAFHDRDFERILPHAPPDQRRRGIQDLTWEE